MLKDCPDTVSMKREQKPTDNVIFPKLVIFGIFSVSEN